LRYSHGDLQDGKIALRLAQNAAADKVYEVWMNEDTSATLVLADGTTINVLADGTVLTSMPDNGTVLTSTDVAAASVSKWQTPVPMAEWTELLGGGRGRNHPSTPRPPTPPHTHTRTHTTPFIWVCGWVGGLSCTYILAYISIESYPPALLGVFQPRSYALFHALPLIPIH
jgi:hypothetical protein